MNTEQAKHEWSDILEAVKISIIGWAKELYQDGIADGMNGGESFEDGFEADASEAISCLLEPIEQAALRAQQDISPPEPCEYCDENNQKYIYISEAMEPRIFFDLCGANLRFFDEQYEGGFCDLFKINFCPMCGRKLEPKEADKCHA